MRAAHQVIIRQGRQGASRSPPPERRHCRCRYARCVANDARPHGFRVPRGCLPSAWLQSAASRMLAVRLVAECLEDACRPLGFRVPRGCLPSTTCRPLGFRVPRGWLPSDWFQGASRMESGTNLGLLSPWQSRGGRHTQGEPGAWTTTRTRPRTSARRRGEDLPLRPPPLPPSSVTARRRVVVDSAARASAVPHCRRRTGRRTQAGPGGRGRGRGRGPGDASRRQEREVRVCVCVRVRVRARVRARACVRVRELRELIDARIGSAGGGRAGASKSRQGGTDEDEDGVGEDD